MLESMRSTQSTMFSNAKANFKTDKEKFKLHQRDVSKLTESTADTSFLQFVRPGTAYGATMYDMSSSGGSFGSSTEDLTRPNTSWNKTKKIKPSSIIKSRGGNSKSKNMMWFDRAERIYSEVTNTTQVLENIEYMCSMVHNLHSDFIPNLENNTGKDAKALITRIWKFMSNFGCS